jgi:glyoxylase-like metal-dependent hydrolase (beta-lactamase superfamily II)
VDHVTGRAPASEDDRHAWAEPGTEDLGGGLYRIPLPLPNDALAAVNVYAITGDHGVDLIDAGMALAQARERLADALGGLGYGLPDIRNFFITHVHQDHYTLAIALRGTVRGKIMLGEQERANLVATMRAFTHHEEPGFIQMLDRMGAADLAAQVRSLLGTRPGADDGMGRPGPVAGGRRHDRAADPHAPRHPHARAHQRAPRVPRRGRCDAFRR